MVKNKGVIRWIVSWVVVGVGMTLSACQSTDAGAVMAIEDEGGQSRTIVKKIIGGVVLAVKRHNKTRRLSLVMMEAQVSPSGRPECRLLTGRRLSIGHVRMVFKERPGRLKSAMVVMGGPEPASFSALAPGDCVSVAPDDIDRPSSSLASSIEIETADTVAQKSDRLGKGIVELWAQAPLSVRVALGLKKAAGQIHRAVTLNKRAMGAPIGRPLKHA